MQDDVTIYRQIITFIENVEHFEYLRTTLKNRNSLYKEIESRSKSVKACYHSVQSLLSFSALSKNIKFKIYRTIILPVVLYERETLSLTLTEERRPCLLQNSLLRRIFGPKRGEVTGDWKKLHKNELNDLYSSPNVIR